MSAKGLALPAEAPRSPPAFNYDPILKIKRSKEGSPVAAPIDGLRASAGLSVASSPANSVTLSFLRGLPSTPKTKELIAQEEAFLVAQRNANETLAALAEQLRIKMETLRSLSEAQDDELRAAEAKLRELQQRRRSLLSTPRLQRSGRDRGALFLGILLVQWICCIVLILLVLNIL